MSGRTVPGFRHLSWDIVAGMLACKRNGKGGINALIDLGTNGRWSCLRKKGNFCTATAAGPAFDGGFEERFSVRMSSE